MLFFFPQGIFCPEHHESFAQNAGIREHVVAFSVAVWSQCACKLRDITDYPAVWRGIETVGTVPVEPEAFGFV